MKKARILVRPRAGHQHHWGNAFAEGLRRHGWQVEIVQGYEPSDLTVLWGIRRAWDIEATKKNGGEVCILERGYIGDRYKFTSVSFGGKLNGEACFSSHGIDGARVEKHFSKILKPWKWSTDNHALVLGQVVTDMSVAGLQVEQMYADLAAEARSLDYEVKFRPHPLGQSRCEGVPVLGGDLDQALAWASVALTVSSNSGVDAVVAGVPCVAIDSRSMVWNVSTRSPRHQERPDRTDWLQRLSYAQWNVEEMASGECWEHARHGVSL